MAKTYKNEFERNQGKWDPHNSTYRWTIYLANGRILTGYSKGLNIREVMDKDTLIQKNISRLYKSGYLQKASIGTDRDTDKIYFFYNQELDAEPFLILYPDAYELLEIDNAPLFNFLEKFYEMKRTGKEVKNLIKPAKDQRDPLDVEVPRFPNIRSLTDYCNMLIRKKIRPTGAIENFFRNYKSKHFSHVNSQANVEVQNEKEGREAIEKMKNSLANKYK